MAEPIQNKKSFCVYCTLLQSIITNPVPPMYTAATEEIASTSILQESKKLLDGMHDEDQTVFTRIFREIDVLAHSILHIQGLLERLSEEVKYSPNHTGYDKAKHEFEELVKPDLKRQKN